MESVRAVERALELLESFSAERQEIGLSELSRKLTLPKATTLRIARTLEKKGYLYQDSKSSMYRLGARVLPLGQVFLKDLNYCEVALPYMQALRDRTEEAVTLYIAVSDVERMCVQRVNSKHVLRQVVAIGDVLPMGRGSAGKLLLAYQGDNGKKNGVDEKELERILHAGYAVSADERSQGLYSISAPIFDHQAKVIASLTLSGPIFRLDENNMEYFSRKVVAVAKEISCQLGWSGMK